MTAEPPGPDGRGPSTAPAAPTAPAIRLAVPADAPGVGRVHVESWQATYPGIVPQPILERMSVERRAAFWREAITRSLDGATDAGERVWVAVGEAGEVAGFASIGPARDDDLPPRTGELYAIYLAPEHWSTGLGRRLHDAAVDDLAVRHDPLVLWVLTDNARARRFYKRAGWMADGSARILDFDGTPIEEIRYRLRVATLTGDVRSAG
ncbi:MAG TPA: GNAT family N-acetyltransferase [Candidatus Limnocylindrales bacterium]|nr:GNAT family N-acetyltransferase [Candidatus Limnocylindrales bacterium]